MFSLRHWRTLVQHWLPGILLAVFFAAIFVGVRTHSQSWYFQDETEHVAVGWVLNTFDRQLYADISTNHQPLPIFVGAVLAQAIPQPSLFTFITGLRYSMWLFAFGTSAFLTWRFRWRGVLASLFTYSLGYQFFAWHVLAESLVIPAVLFLLLINLKQTVSKWDSVLTGLSLFWIVFTLTPLWPFAFLAGAYYCWKHRLARLKPLLLGLLLPTFALWITINPFQWWQETVVNNILYFIPYEAAHDQWHYLRLITYPLWHLTFITESALARFYVAALLIVGVTLWKKHRQISVPTIFAILLLVLSLNPRISDLNVTFYRGFHLYPYIAGLSVFIAWSLTNWWKNRHSWQTKGISLLFLLILLNNTSWVLEKKDRLNEHHIQYSVFQSYGAALKSLHQPGDTLLTGPEGSGYMNMQANMPFAGRQNFHLPWAFRTPYLRENWIQMMTNEPPTFIYFQLGTDPYSLILQPTLKSNYYQLQRQDGSFTDLFIHKNAIKQKTEAQWKQFEEQAWQRPTIELQE